MKYKSNYKIKNLQQKGFTLVELMIVVAIIGILASIAIPIFQDYSIRSKVSEGLLSAYSAKVLVAENANNGLADFSNNWNIPAGTANVISTTIDVNGVITVTTSAAAGNGTIVLTPQDGAAAITAGTVPSDRLEWFCNAAGSTNGAGAAGTLQAKYAPAQCR